MTRQFVSPRVIYGPGSLDRLATLPGRLTAIVTDDGVMERLGVLARACGYLAQGGSRAHIAGHIGREPRLSDLPSLVEALRSLAPGRIVALGGGSVIDAAKAAWAFYEHPSLDWARVLRFDGLPATPPQTELVAIPTTSGTGSEVSGVAVLIDDDTRLKRLIMSPGLVPALAVVDPDLPASMPHPSRPAQRWTR